MTTPGIADDGSHEGGPAPEPSRPAIPREHIVSVVDFALRTALDPAIAAAAIRDTLLVLDSRPTSGPPTVEPLVVLSHARAEVWRQLRARGIHPDTTPDIRLDAEPLAALSPAERTALYLSMRRRLPHEDVGFVMDCSTRTVKKLRRSASVALVRAVTALTLSIDLTPCPGRDAIAARGAGMLSRRDVDALTMHAAECRVCVEWLRKADHHALDNYSALEQPTAAVTEAVMVDLSNVDLTERTRVSNRAGRLRSDGRPPRESRLDADPRRWLKRGIGFAVASVVLVLVGILALAV